MSGPSRPPSFDSPWWSAVWGLLLLGLALGFAIGAGRLAMHIASRPSLEASRAHRAAIEQWPAAAGTLHRLTLIKKRAGRGPGVIYEVRVEYHYAVASRIYVGNRLTPDDSWRWRYSANSSDDFRHVVVMLAPGLDYQKFRDASQCAALGAYDECEVDFKLEQPLQVHYNPDNPEDSVVDVDELDPITLVDHMVAPFAWMAFLVLGVVASMSGVWGMFLRVLHRQEDGVDRGGATSRLWRWTGGALFLSLCLESYTFALAGRGMSGSFREVLGLIPGVALCAITGLLAVCLFFQPAIDSKWRRGRRRWRGRWNQWKSRWWNRRWSRLWRR